MTDRQSFVLTRATSSDLSEIVDGFYASFPEDERTLFQGCRGREQVPSLLAKHQERMKTDTSEVWMQVRAAGTNELIAASNWKIYLNGKPQDRGLDVPDWLSPEENELSRLTIETTTLARRRAMPEAFIHLQLLFTVPGSRRQGAGKLMLAWGCNLADMLSLPMWVEASPDGTLLYTPFGFEVFDRLSNNGVDTIQMKRPAGAKQKTSETVDSTTGASS